MYNTNDSVDIKIIDSIKNIVIISLVILLALVLLGGYFLLDFVLPEGRELGRIIFPLFILSEIPLLVNYVFFVINRFGLKSKTLSQLFIRYYTPCLIFHSGIFTIVVGMTFIHSVVAIQQSVFCLLLLLTLGFLWAVEFLFWFINWPLYPQRDKNVVFLYFFHWIVLFGLLIGLPFHAKAWSLIWVGTFSPLSFGSLLVIIFQEIRNREKTGQTIGKSKKQSLVT
ncbi:MAG: hypothetical protein ACFFDC_12045 [Promethearchaeota archaeon]